MSASRLIVIGASEGGVHALIKLVRGLPPHLPAAILVVVHIDAHASSLPALLARQTSMRVCHGQSGMPILDSHIYVAPSDFHMLIDGAKIRLWRGPKEHYTRPAVDPLFRSAAETWESHLLGVVLTGNLNDGTLGLQAVKRAGGTTIAQDPEEAQARGMPTSAVQASAVDAIVSLNEIPAFFERWAKTSDGIPSTALQSIAMKMSPETTATDAFASDRSPFVCPTCRGSLARKDGGSFTEMSCYTGHRFTLETFAKAQSDATDDALWCAYRAVKEKEMLVSLLASNARASFDIAAAESFSNEQARVSKCAQMLWALTEALPGTFSQLPS